MKQNQSQHFKSVVSSFKNSQKSDAVSKKTRARKKVIEDDDRTTYAVSNDKNSQVCVISKTKKVQTKKPSQSKKRSRSPDRKAITHPRKRAKEAMTMKAVNKTVTPGSKKKTATTKNRKATKSTSISKAAKGSEEEDLTIFDFDE